MVEFVNLKFDKDFDEHKISAHEIGKHVHKLGYKMILPDDENSASLHEHNEDDNSFLQKIYFSLPPMLLAYCLPSLN